MAELLWNDFKITIIDPKEYFEHIVLNIKTCIDPKWAQFLLFSYDSIQTSHEDKFTFIQGTLVNVNNDDSIEVKYKDGEISRMEYDFLILCTGFSYEQPIKDESALTINDR
jgi:NADH dehydrogenase FAD-containing subunit